jgi:membrane fusion protein, multidrug efflux system
MVTTHRIMPDESRLDPGGARAEDPAPRPGRTDVEHPQREAPGYTQGHVVPRRSKRRWVFAITALILIVLVGGFYYFNYFVVPAKIAEEMAKHAPPPFVVSGATAAAEDVPQYLEGIGSLKAVHQVTLAPQVEGRVEAILFEAGTKVDEGQPLVQLDDEAEKGDLLVYQAMERLGEVSLQRAQELYGRRTGPKTAVDESQAQRDQARGNIARVQALLDHKVVTAPFSGRIGVRQIEVGQYLSPGTMIATLTDLSQLYVNFTLPESTRSQISLGQAVKIGVDAYPGRVFDAKLTTVEPQVSTDMRQILLQATMDNPGEVLLPGMFASARIVLAPQKSVVTLPQTAVDYSLYGDFVYLLTEAGKDDKGKAIYTAKQTFVKTGQRFENKVAILEGLKPGEMVVSSGQIKLQNGARVQIGDGAPLTPPETPPAY